jgi:hypothetical protein
MTGRPLELVVYGDFNCPFSAVASVRAAHLEQVGIARVTWRAVEHDPEIPDAGIPVEGPVSNELDQELEQIRSLLVVGDGHVALRRPPVRANTRLATAVYASTPPSRRAALRADIFRRYWSDQDGLLADAPAEVTEPGRATAADWRDEWLANGAPMVPVMRLPDGYVSRGLGALRRLAELRDGPGDGTDRG